MVRSGIAVHGVLNINKPAGISSYDVIRKLKPVLKPKRLGHAGTLDPMATGVLLVLVNEATRISRLLDLPKEYQAEIRFGIETDTDDITGRVIRTAPVPALETEELRQRLARFQGELLQVPPQYSALKKNGTPLYKLARQGRAPAPAPRLVTVYALILEEWNPPVCRVWCRVSAGTYVRALARDIGRELGSAATLGALVRTRIGEFTLENSHSLSAVLNAGPGIGRLLVPEQKALAHLAQLVVTREQAQRLRNGGKLTLNQNDTVPSTELCLVLSPEQDFIALVRVKAGLLIPERIIYAAEPGEMK
ncbi:MAG: tRNA pseudouridine(55) synthase TruB [candidate division WOR-3 bacterium]|jgi:tRNA pseudouridine55 synthase